MNEPEIQSHRAQASTTFILHSCHEKMSAIADLNMLSMLIPCVHVPEGDAQPCLCSVPHTYIHHSLLWGAAHESRDRGPDHVIVLCIVADVTSECGGRRSVCCKKEERGDL